MSRYPHMTEDFVLRRLPMVRGWAYYNWALEADPYSSAKRDGSGYLGQEIKARKAT